MLCTSRHIDRLVHVAVERQPSRVLTHREQARFLIQVEHVRDTAQAYPSSPPSWRSERVCCRIPPHGNAPQTATSPHGNFSLFQVPIGRRRLCTFRAGRKKKRRTLCKCCKTCFEPKMLQESGLGNGLRIGISRFNLVWRSSAALSRNVDFSPINFVNPHHFSDSRWTLVTFPRTLSWPTTQSNSGRAPYS